MSELERFIQAGQHTISNLIFDHYQETSLTTTELVVYLFLDQWQAAHHQAPELSHLAKRLRLPIQTIEASMTSLVHKQAIQLFQSHDAHGKPVQRYDLSLFLAPFVQDSSEETVVSDRPDARVQVFDQIEVEFGRPLSPIEQQSIQDWLDVDHYDPEVIMLALREAVMNSAYSLKYMDRILLNWERRSLKTPQQVQEAIRRRNEL